MRARASHTYNGLSQIDVSRPIRDGAQMGQAASLEAAVVSAAGELLQGLPGLRNSAVLGDSRRVDPLSQGAPLEMASAIGE